MANPQELLSQLLSVAPTSQQFGPAQENDLSRALGEAEKNSLFYPLTSTKEVLLAGDGKTQTGYRFTHWAFFQLCQALCPGLYRLVMELSGSQRSSDKPRSDYSSDEAVQVVNLLIRRRFGSRLYGRNILRDTKTGIIHGIVGAGYHWLPNKQLHDRCRDLLRNSRKRVLFHEGLLNGRWLMIRYRQQDPLFADDGKIDFFGGMHFSNNEVGVASIKSGAVLLRGNDWSGSLTPTRRVIHSLNRRFEAKLEAMLADTENRLKDAEFYRKKVILLHTHNLMLGMYKTDQEEEKRRDAIIHALTARKLPQSLAKRVLREALRCGSFETARSAESHRGLKTVWASRTQYDLYNAIAREARQLSIGNRELSEQVAYALLMGRINFI